MLIGTPSVFPSGMGLFFLELLRPKEDFRNPLREILSLSENKDHPNLAASTTDLVTSICGLVGHPDASRRAMCSGLRA